MDSDFSLGPREQREEIFKQVFEREHDDQTFKPLTTYTEQQTIDYGYQLAALLNPNSVICLFGDLGAGKTTLIKGIVHYLTETPVEEVSSPTYHYLSIYEGKCPVYHFDLYRLQSHEEFLNLGFEEYLFSGGGVCCLEWSERIEKILPKMRIHLTMEHLGENCRKIRLIRPLA